MVPITFNYIKLYNFKGYYKENIIDLRPENDKPIILIGGRNEAGKTSIIDAIKICLYGTYFIDKKIRKKSEYINYIDQSINRNALKEGDKKAFIEINLSYLHFDKLRTINIRRTLDADLNFDDCEDLEIFDNENNLTREILRQEYQEYIFNIIPISISQFFIFDAEKIQELANDNVDHVLNDIFALFNIEIYRQLRKDIKESCVSEFEKNFFESEVKGSDLLRLSSQKAELDENLNNKNETLQIIEKEINKLDIQKEELEIELRRLGTKEAKDLGGLEEKINSLTKKDEDFQNQIFNSLDDIFFIVAQPIIEKTILQLDDDFKLISNIKSAEKKEKQRELIIEKLFGDNSPESNPCLTYMQKHFYKERLKEEWNEIFELNSHKGSNMSTIHDIDENLLAQTKSQCDRLNIQQVDWEYIINAREIIVSELNFLKIKKNEIGRNTSDDRIIKMLDETKRLNNTIEEKKAQKFKIISQIEHIKNEQLTLSKEISNKKSNQDRANAYKTKLELSKKVDQLLEDFIVQLAETKRQIFEKNFHDKYRELSERKDLFQIKVGRDFKVIIEDSLRNLIPKSTLSAGGKQLYAIAMLWGLSQTAGSHLPIVIDTPLGRLDRENREILAKKYFSHASHQMIILSTNTEVDDLYLPYLEPYISKKYLIKHNKEKEISTIQDGYF